MKSFIPWIGGKTLLAKKITAEFPTEYERYIEVFGGGGSVLFSSECHAPMEVYNDANGNLVNLFRCIKYHPQELEKEICGYINSRELFSELSVRLACPGFTDIQRAAMFYVQIKLSFGADVRSFGCCKTGNKLSTNRFAEISERLKNVVIEHKDFADLIKVYDRPNALIYCDPPYHTTERHYSEKFTEEDHLRLRNILGGIEGKFILSYNDDGFARELYKDYKIIPVERSNNISSGTFKELIIKNF
jgi:DNA adenine methylase